MTRVCAIFQLNLPGAGLNTERLNRAKDPGSSAGTAVVEHCHWPAFTRRRFTHAGAQRPRTTGHNGDARQLELAA
jgi:hypothetical protein